VLLDALGTLVRLEPPAPRLRAALAARGMEVSLEQAERALAAEIAFYLDHHLEGSDREGLERLRDRCAEVAGRVLGLGGEQVRQPLLHSLSFSPFPDAVPALEELRASGATVVVVSNWDCSLPEVLGRAGLLGLVDHVVASASVGYAKPHPAPFRAALGWAGVRPGEALHAGDSAENDLAGAQAAGIRGVLVDRSGEAPPPAVHSLRELPRLL